MISEKDLGLLGEAILEKYGLDFRDYAYSSLARRIQRLMDTRKIESVADLIGKINGEDWFHNELLDQITVNVTEMFRDPEAWMLIRQQVIPKLRDRGKEIKIWHAGCSSGEEVISMAIIIKEMQLEDRTSIRASDLDQTIINKAMKAEYALNKMDLNEKNYKASGGEKKLGDYYSTEIDRVQMDPGLLEKVHFDVFDLVKNPPNEKFDLILCRNVMIYFNQSLQNKVLEKIYDSLNPGGFLSIGTKESLLWCDIANEFEVISQTGKIYRRP